MSKNILQSLLGRKPKPEKITITEDDLEKFRQWLRTASREEIEEQAVSDEQREEILAEVRQLSRISKEELDRRCELAF